MNEVDALDLMRLALTTVILGSAPAVGAAMAVGVVVALFQALTQVQEATLTFVPKIIAVFVVVLITGGWVVSEIQSFTQNTYDTVDSLVRH